MSNLEYKSSDTISKDKLYGMIHKCKKCPFNTKSLFFIKNHVKSHQCVDPLEWFDCSQSDLECFICIDCNFITYLSTPFKNHLKNHTVKIENTETSSQAQNENAMNPLGETVKSEDYYSETFTQNSLKESECLPEKLFNCDKCPYKSKWPRTLYYHKISEHGLLPKDDEWFYCDQCPYKSKREYVVQEHVMKQHTSLDRGILFLEDIKLFKCEQCLFTSKYKCVVKKHILYKHTSWKDVKWLYCYKCSYKTKVKYDLQTHSARRHSPDKIHSEKIFSCESCVYKTNLKKNMRRHMTSNHSSIENARWLHCNECTYQTKFKYDMWSHMENIHDFKFFQCKDCPSKYRFQTTLRKHIREKHR